MADATITEQILNALGVLSLATVGGGSVSVAVIKFYGQNWVKHQFAKDLAEEKSKLAKELEGVKAEISLLNTKRLKLHDKEYEVFPEVWSLLKKTHAETSTCIVSMRSMPDFAKYSQEDLNTWVSRSDLTESEKDYFLSENDKVKAYGRILDARQIQKANECYFTFKDYYESNRIFLNPYVKEKIDEISSLLRQAWASKSVDFDHPNQRDFSLITEALNICEKQIIPMFNDLELIVQKQLFPEQDKEIGG